MSDTFENTPGIGHNDAPVGADAVKKYVKRIEWLEAEKKSIAEDIREVYVEAKSRGITPKALRRVIRLRKEDVEKRRAEQAEVDDIMHKLGMPE